MAFVNNISLPEPLMAQVEGAANLEKRSTDELVGEAVRSYLRNHPAPVATDGGKPVESLVQQERRERLAR